ncbi:MAG: hypothetical protein F6K19_13625 [Cyanothece sp. SIO1E1]|nr:hypothetical protein [Cyanothece sp. SIO1E1]
MTQPGNSAPDPLITGAESDDTLSAAIAPASKPQADGSAQSDANTTDEEKVLGQLQSLLTGGVSNPEYDAPTSLPAEAAAPSAPEEVPEEGRFNLLQDILVRPELVEFRDRITKIEYKVTKVEYRTADLERKTLDLEGQLDRSDELVKALLPLVTELLNHKLAEFKQEIVEAIAPLIEEREISIRVTGLGQDVEVDS